MTGKPNNSFSLPSETRRRSLAGSKQLRYNMEVALAVIVALIVAAVTWKPFFGDLENFSECVTYWFTPDAWSFFNGDYGEDFWAELKLSLWVMLSCGAGYGMYQLFLGLP